MVKGPNVFGLELLVGMLAPRHANEVLKQGLGIRGESKGGVGMKEL